MSIRRGLGLASMLRKLDWSRLLPFEVLLSDVIFALSSTWILLRVNKILFQSFTFS